MRQYLVGSWNDADTYDYSGEMLMGSRQGKSVCVDHMLPNGRANLARYADTDPVKPPKTAPKKRSVADSIDLANRNYERLEKLSEALDIEYMDEDIDDERYALLRSKMDQRLAKAWKRLQHDNAKHSPEWNVEDIDDFYDTEENQYKESIEKSFTAQNEWDNIFLSLKQSNSFRKLYISVVSFVRSRS